VEENHELSWGAARGGAAARAVEDDRRHALPPVGFAR
jgi:hypothetical protein